MKEKYGQTNLTARNPNDRHQLSSGSSGSNLADTADDGAAPAKLVYPNLTLINAHAPGEDRTQIVQRMAADLVRYEAFGNEGDAMRSLMAAGHSPFYVMRFVDDARQVAMQEVVAKEMSKP